MNRPKTTGTTAVTPNPYAGQTMAYDRIEDKSAFQSVMDLDIGDFMDHTYHGTHGYRDGSYLIPHARETLYNTRRKKSYYVNVLKPVVNCMVDEVFCNPIKRETDDAMYLKFIDDADNCGTHLDAVEKDIIFDARLKDLSFCVMDNYSSQEIEEQQTEEKAIAARVFPYIYMKKRQELKSYTVNRFGGFASVTFLDEVIIEGAGKDMKEVQTYKRWDYNTWTTFKLEKNKDGKEETEITIAKGAHNIGELPVYPVLDFARTKNVKTLPDPSLYDIAYLSFALYNKESEVVVLEDNQCFSILCLSGADAQTIQSIGPQNFISVSSDSKFTPAYISPDAAHLVNMVANCDRLEEKIYKHAQQKGVVAVKTELSGLAKQMDFRAEEGVLKTSSKATARLDDWIKYMLGKYVKKEIKGMSYFPEQFSPTYKSDQITEGLRVIEMGAPAALALREWKRIALMRFGPDKETGDTLESDMQAEIEMRQERLARELERGHIEDGEIDEIAS